MVLDGVSEHLPEQDMVITTAEMEYIQHAPFQKTQYIVNFCDVARGLIIEKKIAFLTIDGPIYASECLNKSKLGEFTILFCRRFHEIPNLWHFCQHAVPTAPNFYT